MRLKLFSTALLRVPVLLPAFLAAVSCGPSAYILDVETSRPSASGIGLAGKSVSVVYLDDRQTADSMFAANMAAGFVSRLEEDYFGGDSIVPLFCLEKSDSIDYSSKTSMVDLLVDTGTDVVFLLDAPSFGTPAITRDGPNQDGLYAAEGAFPFSVNLYVYDSMDSRDTVRMFSGSSVASVSSYVKGTESKDGVEYILKSQLDGTAVNVGRTSGSKFAPVWRTEEVMFFLYESQIWYETYYQVNDYEWQKAMDIWMSLLDTGDLRKKACLEYNLAAACYIQGQYGLAKEWIDLSETHFDLPYTHSMKQKISQRMSLAR